MKLKEEIIEAKSKLEEEINVAIAVFTEKTGLTIDRIIVPYYNIKDIDGENNYTKNIIQKVKVTIKIT